MKEEDTLEDEAPYVDREGICAWPKCRRETSLFIRIEEEGKATRRIPLCDGHGDQFLSENPKEEKEAYRALKLKKDTTLYPATPSLFTGQTTIPLEEPPEPEDDIPKEVTKPPKLEVDSKKKLHSLLDRLRAGEFELEDG